MSGIIGSDDHKFYMLEPIEFILKTKQNRS